MTKNTYRKLVSDHLLWSMTGLVVALVFAYVSSEHRLVVYGVPMVETTVESGKCFAPSTFIVPASAPGNAAAYVVPDTVDGVLIWPDPWDTIKE